MCYRQLNCFDCVSLVPLATAPSSAVDCLLSRSAPRHWLRLLLLLLVLLLLLLQRLATTPTSTSTATASEKRAITAATTCHTCKLLESWPRYCCCSWQSAPPLLPVGGVDVFVVPLRPSPTSCSACTVGKYCYSFTSYDDKAQKWHCGNSADETIMLTLSLWLTHPPTQQKLSRLCGRWRARGSIEGNFPPLQVLCFSIFTLHFRLLPFARGACKWGVRNRFLLCDKCKNWNCSTLLRDPQPCSLLSLRISLLLSTFIVAAKVKCQLELKYGWAEWGSGLPLTSSSSPTLWICKPNF